MQWSHYIVRIICLYILASCSAYDESLLNISNDSATSGDSSRPEKSKKGDSSGNSGSDDGGSDNGGDSGNGVELNSKASDAGIYTEYSEFENCGNGRVSDEETCDIAIEAGMPGACPTECPADSLCISYRLTGKGCQVRCEKVLVGCNDGDGCCPKDCNSENDSDCSSSCGDGIVQADEGENCEPSSALKDAGPDAGPPCPTECEEDTDPCTVEILIGSEDNCNAQCTQSEITGIVNGDECCPRNANANTDSDCEPICGNGIRESDEECDGSESCSDQCTATYTEEQSRCINDFDIYQSECEVCMCTNCRDQTLKCFDSGNEQLDTDCSNIVSCSQREGCTGMYCYCGTSLNPATNTCILVPANGPCKAEIEAAAGTSDIYAIGAQMNNLNTAVGRSIDLGNCDRVQCVDICQ